LNRGLDWLIENLATSARLRSSWARLATIADQHQLHGHGFTELDRYLRSLLKRGTVGPVSEHIIRDFARNCAGAHGRGITRGQMVSLCSVAADKNGGTLACAICALPFALSSLPKWLTDELAGSVQFPEVVHDPLSEFRPEAQRSLNIDHIIPLSVGGASVEENLQALCAFCNLGKGVATSWAELQLTTLGAIPVNSSPTVARAAIVGAMWEWRVESDCEIRHGPLEVSTSPMSGSPLIPYESLCYCSICDNSVALPL
jgi:hypothetical protein